MLENITYHLNSVTPANGPSKTGNPSGGGRGNNPSRGK